MSSWASEQIEAALRTGNSKSAKKGVNAQKPGTPRHLKGESPGEASVRMALYAAFGDWQRGGEVVPELMPFKTRRFRADFALPRYKLAIEVDGWSHHGEHKDDHHRDRERGLFFSSHDWLPFRVSHGQAINSPGMLVDAIASAMTYRQPLAREVIEIVPVEHKNGVWYRLNLS